MKTCSKCKEEKPFSEFYFEHYRQKYSEWCACCQKDKNKKYYNLNKDKYKKNKYERVKWFYDYKKTLKCSHCGENNYIVIEFHHLDPAQKDFGVSMDKIPSENSKNKEKFMEEIKKCIPLCANCHRIEHSKQMIEYFKTKK